MIGYAAVAQPRHIFRSVAAKLSYGSRCKKSYIYTRWSGTLTATPRRVFEFRPELPASDDSQGPTRPRLWPATRNPARFSGRDCAPPPSWVVFCGWTRIRVRFRQRLRRPANLPPDHHHPGTRFSKPPAPDRVRRGRARHVPIKSPGHAPGSASGVGLATDGRHGTW